MNRQQRVLVPLKLKDKAFKKGCSVGLPNPPQASNVAFLVREVAGFSLRLERRENTILIPRDPFVGFA
jgi:hypothetical protein